MKIKLKLFAYLREAIGLEEEEIKVRDGKKVGDLWIRYKDKIPGHSNFRVLFAVNGEYVEGNTKLKEGDEVAFIPLP